MPGYAGPFSSDERIWIVKKFGEVKSATLVRRAFQREFPRISPRNVPHRKQFFRVIEKFEASGDVKIRMPASKKDLKKLKQRQNVAAGIGDEKGRIPSNNKTPNVMVACTICKQQIRMVKKNEQAKQHVDSKHAGKKFDECFPGYTCE